MPMRRRAMQPRFPLYIVSKGRWKRRLTSRALEQIGIPYFMVVEEQEADLYRAAVDPAFATVLVLDPAYQRAYDPCTELAPDQSRGSGPARNFVWDHAVAGGFDWHWILDDNI